MLTDLKAKVASFGLHMNLNKTNYYYILLYYYNNCIEKYVYLGQLIKLGKENKPDSRNSEENLHILDTRKLGNILKNSTIPINLKKKIFNACILPLIDVACKQCLSSSSLPTS